MIKLNKTKQNKTKQKTAYHRRYFEKIIKVPGKWGHINITDTRVPPLSNNKHFLYPSFYGRWLLTLTLT